MAFCACKTQIEEGQTHLNSQQRFQVADLPCCEQKLRFQALVRGLALP